MAYLNKQVHRHSFAGASCLPKLDQVSPFPTCRQVSCLCFFLSVLACSCKSHSITFVVAKHSEHNRYVNIILVRSPFETEEQEDLYERYKDEILFLGIMSLEAYPLLSPNPHTTKFRPEDYISRFPGYVDTNLMINVCC